MSRQHEARRRLDVSAAILQRLLEPVTQNAPATSDQPIALDLIRHRIGEQLAGWPSARTEAGAGDGPAAWCWTHEREVTRCHNAGHPCTGDPISGPSDSTGEAAVAAAKDRALADLADLDRLLARILVDVKDLGLLAARYLDPSTRQPDKGCELCAAVNDDNGRPCWSPIYMKASNLGGLLPRRMSVCRWHERWLKATDGKHPTRDQVKRHNAGDRVPAPKKVGAR